MSLTLKLYNIKHMYLVTFLYFSSLGFVALCFYLDFEFRCAFLASQVVLVVKNPPASAGDLGYVGVILGWGDSLEEGMATHSSILAWRISGQRSLVVYSP